VAVTSLHEADPNSSATRIPTGQRPGPLCAAAQTGTSSFSAHHLLQGDGTCRRGWASKTADRSDGHGDRNTQNSFPSGSAMTTQGTRR
jgi:hypothetical protein